MGVEVWCSRQWFVVQKKKPLRPQVGLPVSHVLPAHGTTAALSIGAELVVPPCWAPVTWMVLWSTANGCFAGTLLLLVLCLFQCQFNKHGPCAAKHCKRVSPAARLDGRVFLRGLRLL